MLKRLPLASKRVLIQSSYVIMQQGKFYVAPAVIASALYSFALIAIGGVMWTAELFYPVLLITAFIYAVAGVAIVSGLADELSSGHAMLFMAHGVRRTEYVLSWILAGPALLVMIYLLSSLVPMIIVDVSLIKRMALTCLLIILQLLYQSAIPLFIAVSTKNKTYTQLAGLSVLIFVPLLAMLVAIIAAILDVEPNPVDIGRILSLGYPAVHYLVLYSIAHQVSEFEALMISITYPVIAVITVMVLTFITAKGRLEV